MRKKITAEDIRVGDVIRFYGSKKNWLVKKSKIGYVGEFHSGIYMSTNQGPVPEKTVLCMRVILENDRGDLWNHAYTFNYRFWRII